jgi:hypothetical protein
MGIRIYCFSIILAIVLASQAFAQELYKISTKEMGITVFDYTVTESKREDQYSVVRIPGFHGRSAPASRWMMCVYADLAQERGVHFYAAVYPDPPSEDITVYFPFSPDEDIVQTLGPEIRTENVMPIMPVHQMLFFCNRNKKITK